MELISSALPWAQIIFSVLLVITILFQQSDAGLGTAFGGGSSSGGVYKKRGIERQIFFATIILALLFTLSTILALFI